MPAQQDRVRVDTAPGHPVESPLLASRLTPAVPPEPVVARPRLLRRLDEAGAGPVTLVAAPAGWGKTTLLATWVRLAGGSPDVEPGAIVPDSGQLPDEPEPSSAWVSVEVGDDGDRLWAYLAAALRSATGSTEGGPVPDRPPRPDQLELLAATLANADRPVLLILDDLHRIADPAALTGLEFLLRHAGQRLRLVIGARAGLHLPLHRLRLAGELTEIGPDDLAFTDDEVADLLTAHGAALPAVAVHQLRERTGGWPAALRIAALAVRGQPDPERWVGQFGGDQPEIAGYLHEEVLATLDPAEVDLLRRTALVENVCADLAEALTGRADAGQALADLAGTGGLLHREDTRPPWYRCEPLLADLLRADLARLPGDELRELHVRAADWYAGDGRPTDGLRHALAAGRWDLAGDLFVAHWPELTRYDRDPVHAPTPASPPTEVIRADPEVALACAAERAYAGDLPAATGHLRAAAGHAAGLPVPRRDRFLRLVTALELTVARLADDPAEARAAAARLLRTRPAGATPTRVPDSAPPGVTSSAPTAGGGGAADDADLRAFTGTALGLVELAEGALPAARFVRARAAAREAGRPRTELVGASRGALLLAVRGELRAAEQAARDALGMPPCRGWSCRLDCAYAYLALALVALLRDQPEEAVANLALAGPALGVASGWVGGSEAPTGDGWPAAASGEPVAAAVAALCRAQLHRDSGDPAAGQRLLVRAREALVDRPSAAELAGLLRAAEAELRAERGDLNAARELLGDTAVDETEPALAVALAKVELLAGDTAAAGRTLPAWQAPAATAWPLPVRLDAGLLDAVLAEQAGDGRRAGRILEQVLDLAGPQGCRRVFTRAEPAVRALLAAHLDAGTAHFALVSDLVRGAGKSTARPVAEPGGTLDEPLTERELTILRYLQSILSNVEIASELSLSVNTVKTHVRNIYRKLDATRRREAVRRARELRLI
ncbi:helix-turn-helix transcriptional regulator [Micromonospora parathelypteridis]|uniref:LuxR family maltose regulon positive regulatory protein n=1 Tax=Micromonospora parathelypteridis TaxID=1839617 RepID=A0A840VJM0_9ACTN|nr:LuxR C-terminal-related transcriptional regulator [Micromonospora parathelypteridis]MBB5476855.1 LuxR family maltose regulon positive regulatory protein [Micromonospora parathelypteridis]GGO17358.1 transcriptional regulator [Micromonospora parathelypteridis]